MRRRVLLCGLVIFTALVASSGIVGGTGSVETHTFHSTELAFTVQYDEERRTVSVHVENPSSETVGSTFSITVDGWQFTRENFEIAPRAQRSWTIDVTDGISVMEAEHVVSLETYGGNATFYFVERFDVAEPGDVPVPRVLDVEVSEGMARGNQSTIVSITVTNPSQQNYFAYILVHTFRTDGSFPSFQVMPGETKVVEAEVYEPLGTRVSGEVRFFLQRTGQPRHGLQQFEFTGRANGSTEYWEEDYRAIPGPESENPYHYENASLEPSNESAMIPDPVSLGLYGAGVTAFVGALLAWRKLTSPT